jgi:hypothetical protein
MILNIHRITVARKLTFLGIQARLIHRKWLRNFEKPGAQLNQVQFDEMETFEHTKLKPLSLPLVVTKERKILAFDVASMPAKGLLADKSRQKYGHRKDERKKVIRAMLKGLKGIVSEYALFESDQNPHYPRLLQEVFPRSRHHAFKGRCGSLVGGGELKKIPWDPLFKLNHTAAMYRANINRLFRKTWCTTKRPDRLKDHIFLYVNYHNLVLTPQSV